MAQHTGFPEPPTAEELWWVAVQDAPEASGGWLVLADPEDAGAMKIQSTFAQAGIPILSAVSASDLARALENHSEQRTLALRQSAQGLEVSHHAASPAEVLLELRVHHPADRILLVESQEPVHELLARMNALLASGSFEGIRMDLRSAPRGNGAWGLSLARSA